MIVLLFVVCAVTAVLGVLVWVWRPERIMRRQVRRRVLVTLKDGQAFSGVLWVADRRLVVLKDAAMVVDGGQPVPIDGEVLLHREDISFVQMP